MTLSVCARMFEKQQLGVTGLFFALTRLNRYLCRQKWWNKAAAAFDSFAFIRVAASVTTVLLTHTAAPHSHPPSTCHPSPTHSTLRAECLRSKTAAGWCRALWGGWYVCIRGSAFWLDSYMSWVNLFIGTLWYDELSWVSNCFKCPNHKSEYCPVKVAF